MVVGGPADVAGIQGGDIPVQIGDIGIELGGDVTLAVDNVLV